MQLEAIEYLTETPIAYTKGLIVSEDSLYHYFSNLNFSNNFIFFEGMIRITRNSFNSSAYFYDEGSTYSFNAAIKGGVYYFSNIYSQFEDCEFSDNIATYGGVMYL